MLVNLPLALGIYMGTSVIPGYLNSHRENIIQSNYFLAQNSKITLNEKETATARQCSAIMEESLNDFRLGIKDLGQSAYAEYHQIKLENPEASPYILAGKYMNKFNNFEKSCDSKMHSRLDAIAAAIQNDRGGLNLVEQARYAYTEEKKVIKKEFYREGMRLINKN
ncbi:hypothetical protein DCCM_2925 [Desulfocucumis palustris]|uniref:Uncharacterized protein n=2 Tax=Desulfocucumis palustris TaxID=1898651 RepID=A0A2L2XCT6_9FIRM|nr:hypothetical protein DCCM_2925 [Desulfocucumis palustris]